MGKVKASVEFEDHSSQFNSIDTPASRVRNPFDTVKNRPDQVVKPLCIKADTTEPEIIKMGEVMYVPDDTLK